MGYVVLIILFAIVFIINSKLKDLNNSDTKEKSSNFKYARKDYIMTPYETEFFKRLERISGSKYYVFPQIHLSSLLLNKTSGKYYKAGYQRLRRYAVDYVLVDRQTMATEYAIELDDKTHDARNRRIRDLGLEEDLKSAGVKLVRVRNVNSLTDEEIVQKFVETNNTHMNQLA